MSGTSWGEATKDAPRPVGEGGAYLTNLDKRHMIEGEVPFVVTAMRYEPTGGMRGSPRWVLEVEPWEESDEGGFPQGLLSLPGHPNRDAQFNAAKQALKAPGDYVGPVVLAEVPSDKGNPFRVIRPAPDVDAQPPSQQPALPPAAPVQPVAPAPQQAVMPPPSREQLEGLGLSPEQINQLLGEPQPQATIVPTETIPANEAPAAETKRPRGRPKKEASDQSAAPRTASPVQENGPMVKVPCPQCGQWQTGEGVPLSDGGWVLLHQCPASGQTVPLKDGLEMVA